jgi:hypothetical protein
MKIRPKNLVFCHKLILKNVIFFIDRKGYIYIFNTPVDFCRFLFKLNDNTIYLRRFRR